MNRSQRIWLNDADSDKHLRVKLEQNIDTLEVMTLKINTKEAYQDFNANYGVVVGRVRANNGTVIPNAKISVFIPLDEEDENDGRIVSFYPYKKPTDVNNNNKRYNLLPRVSQFDPEREIYTPKQPFGSFPTKEEILTNPTYFKIYKKYYKYTTTTNEYGDYMIFGVPTGTQTVHMSVDITDIGDKSMTPAAMVNDLGYSENLFTKNNSNIKGSSDLTDLPNIETQEISVDVIPFWGDSQNFNIGITKVDFRIKATISNVFYIFGTSFTDADEAMWGDGGLSGYNLRELFHAKEDRDRTTGIYSKRTANVFERIYYYPNKISDNKIDNNNIDPENDIRILDRSQYTTLKRNGDFIFIVNCNRKKITIDELGREIEVNDNEDGIYTEFRGFVTLQYENSELPLNFSGDIGSDTKLKPLRTRLKFPQYGDNGDFFDSNETGASPNAENDTHNWRIQNKKFKAGKYYGISTFHGTVGRDGDKPDWFYTEYGFDLYSWVNNLDKKEKDWTVGLITTNSYTKNGNNYPNDSFELKPNTIVKDNNDTEYNAFGANWLNLSVYFPQIGYMIVGGAKLGYVQIADYFHNQIYSSYGSTYKNYNEYYTGDYSDNNQLIAANIRDTRNYSRNDLHWTDIIEIPKGDIIKMSEFGQKGFTDEYIGNLTGNNYRNGTNIPSDWELNKPCPYHGGKIDANPRNDPDKDTYFYKGHGDSDCIQFLIDSGVL